METINGQIRLTSSPKPSLHIFSMFSSKGNPRHMTSWKVGQSKANFTLCLIQYECSYNSVGPVGGYTHVDTSLYLFGHLHLRKDYGVSLIRPETLRDKFAEIFESVEIDFKAYPVFSDRYYVVSIEPNHLEARFPPEFFKLMEGIQELQIEFRNRQCLLRLPKSLESKEGIQLCSIGLALDQLLNGAGI